MSGNPDRDFVQNADNQSNTMLEETPEQDFDPKTMGDADEATASGKQYNLRDSTKNASSGDFADEESNAKEIDAGKYPSSRRMNAYFLAIDGNAATSDV